MCLTYSFMRCFFAIAANRPSFNRLSPAQEFYLVKDPKGRRIGTSRKPRRGHDEDNGHYAKSITSSSRGEALDAIPVC
jgi:hypothetical protein